MPYKFDLLYVGAGPSTMFSILKLIKSGYEGKIGVIEKGKSLKDRSPKDVINGSFGAGTFSDSKLSSSLNVGGYLPNLTQSSLEEYEEWLLNEIKSFLGESLQWENTKDFDTTPTSLQWDRHKTLHLGTDRGRKVYKDIEDYLSQRVQFIFESEALSVINLSNNTYQVIIKEKDNSQSILLTDKLIIATGQKSLLPSTLIKEFKLKTIPRAFQLGIRVEDIINKQYEEIIKANYDFKFVKKYLYDNGVSVRVRTFCCNSGNAHTCVENAGLYKCFNGHALKIEDPNNHTVNYGIMCEVEGLKEYQSKETQIELMKSINNISTWEEDNFDIYGNVKPKRKLLDGFPQLEGIYPKEIIESLKSFIKELNQIVDLSKAYYLYPEVKLSGSTPILGEGYETQSPNLYMIGDCVLSRGIIKSSIMGIQFAEHILKNNKNKTKRRI